MALRATSSNYPGQLASQNTLLRPSRPPSLKLQPPDLTLTTSSPASPLGPPPATPLPALPPYPSPISPATITLLRTGEHRSSRRLSAIKHIDPSSPPTSPPGNSQGFRVDTPEHVAYAPPTRKTSSSGISTPEPRPMPVSSSRSLSALSRSAPSLKARNQRDSVQSLSDALGVHMDTLGREADALGIPKSPAIGKQRSSKSLLARPSKQSLRLAHNDTIVNSTPMTSPSPIEAVTKPTTLSTRKTKPLPSLPTGADPRPPSRSSSPDVEHILAFNRRPRSRSRTRAASYHAASSSAKLSYPKSPKTVHGDHARTVSMPSRIVQPAPSGSSYFPDSLYSSGDEHILDFGVKESILDTNSGSDSESSIDLHTPLPHLLVREGLLSASSTVIRSMASGPGASAKGGSSSKKPTELRKRRHRDGKLLREGVGLTTGLGWSDSEDEGRPGPLRHRLSHMLLHRKSCGTSLSRQSTVQEDPPLRRVKSSNKLASPLYPDPRSGDNDEARSSRSTSFSTASSGSHLITPSSSDLSLHYPPPQIRPSLPDTPLRTTPSHSILRQPSKTYIVPEEPHGETSSLSAAAAAYQASKDLSQSVASTRKGSRPSILRRSVASGSGSTTSRDSILSDTSSSYLSSSVTEFGSLRYSRINETPTPPSSYHFPLNSTPDTSHTIPTGSSSRPAKLSNASSSSITSSVSHSLSRSSTATSLSSAASGPLTNVTKKSRLPSASADPSRQPMVAMSLTFPSPPPRNRKSVLSTSSLRRSK